MSFDLEAGQTLGIVGESGSGKSTLARAIIGTVPVTKGQSLWGETDLRRMSPGERRRHRREVQMVFQDPPRLPRSAHERGRDHLQVARLP